MGVHIIAQIFYEFRHKMRARRHMSTVLYFDIARSKVARVGANSLKRLTLQRKY